MEECGTKEAAKAHPFGGNSMPVDFIHLVMGSIYLITWLFIGQIAICRQTETEGDRVNRRP
jgi:hypothetical protein